MNREHLLLLAGFLGAVGVQLATLEHGWREAMTPPFVGALLAQFGIVLKAIYSDRPPRA